jgi:curli biogenesis system outer membrane secretion channel CsgG
MRKTGVLILVLLVLAVMANCAQENSGPAEATQAVPAGSSEVASVEQVTDGTEESQAGSTEAGKPRIAFAQKDFDFGKVETGETIEHIYKFRNTGDGTLVIQKVRSG